MYGPIANKQWEAVVTEVENMKAIDAQEVVECTEDMDILQSTWAFKLTIS